MKKIAMNFYENNSLLKNIDLNILCRAFRLIVNHKQRLTYFIGSLHITAAYTYIFVPITVQSFQYKILDVQRKIY